MDEERSIRTAADCGVAIHSLNDIADAITASLGADGLILTEDDLAPQFFDLRSGLAGEVLQKFVNYGACVAIVVPTPEKYGDRFLELVYEHQRHPTVRFVDTEEAAQAWLRTA